jgi:hypothetical protein
MEEANTKNNVNKKTAETIFRELEKALENGNPIGK